MNEKAPKIMMEVKNINLRFGGVVAIQGVSFDIHEADFDLISKAIERHRSMVRTLLV